MKRTTPVRRAAAGGLVAAALLAATACSSGSDDKAEKTTTTEAAAKTTTTEAKATTTTTTEAPEPDSHPTEDLQAAASALAASKAAANQERITAVKGSDVPAAQAAIAKIRTAYFDFDKDVRDLETEGSDTEEVNELLTVDGDVIAALDEFSKVTDPGQYNEALPAEIAAVNDFQETLGAIATDWGVDLQPVLTTPLPAPQGYTGAGDRISTSSLGFSLEVPAGFIGEGGSATLRLDGPKGALITSGIANYGESSEKTPVAQDELEDFAKDYADRVVDKSGGELQGDVVEVPVGDQMGYGFLIDTEDGPSYDVLFKLGDEDVIDVSLLTDDADQLDRLRDRFIEAVASIQAEG